MALINELSVYRDTFKLVGLLMDYINLFQKQYKYTIGQKIINVSLDLFEYLHLANIYKEDKIKKCKILDLFIVKFELLKVLIRLCGEKHIFTLKQLANISILLEGIENKINNINNKIKL